MLTLLDKLRVIEATGVLGVDLLWLNGNYQRALFHQVRKSSVSRLRELAESRRRAALVCFLWQSYRDAVDQVVDMFDKLLTRAHTQAQNELDEQLCSQRQAIQVSLTALRSLGRIMLHDAISDEELRARLFAAVSREELVACLDKIGEWVTGKRSDLFHGIVRRHGMLRKFSPALLDALELTQDIEGEQSACLRALQMLKELNATGRRNLPEDAPTDFLSQRLKPIVINQGEIDRRAWECALLLKLRDELKAGNLSVRYSKRFARLEEFFIDDRRWQGMREDFFRRSGLPSDSTQVRLAQDRPRHSLSGPETAGRFHSAPKTVPTAPIGISGVSSRPSSSSSTSRSRNCAAGSGAACSKSSNSTPWPGTSSTGGGAGLTPASCGSR